MNFRVLLFLAFFLNLPLVLANSNLETGIYKLDLVVLDSDESYPVSITFKSFTAKDLKNYVTDFDINYSSYKCRATNRKISYSSDFIKINEKVNQGKEYCEDSEYLIYPNNSPVKVNDFFEKIINVTDGKNIAIIVNNVRFTPSPYTKFLRSNNFSSFNDILKSNS